jgi:hypothetical protein
MKYKTPFQPGHLKHNMVHLSDLQPNSRSNAVMKVRKATAFKNNQPATPVLNWRAPANVKPGSKRTR